MEDNFSIFESYRSCALCPKACAVDRTRQKGGCTQTSELRVARAALHFWEEPPLSGYGAAEDASAPLASDGPLALSEHRSSEASLFSAMPPSTTRLGSGTIFFSGCPLRCIYCQNEEISRGRAGEMISVARLARIMLELEGKGALNINLVTPTHFAPSICAAVRQARSQGLTLPVVANVSGYDALATLECMAEIVDIWLVDAKYFSDVLAQYFSAAPKYWEICKKNLDFMLSHIRLRGGLRLRDDETMLQGVIVRHLILPGHTDDSKAFIDALRPFAKKYGADSFQLSLMNQYTPPADSQRLKKHPELSRRLSREEYKGVLDYAQSRGFRDIWYQEEGTADNSFIPPFDAEGVLEPE